MKKILVFMAIFVLTFSYVAYAALYVGNTNSWKFHYYGCKWERKMREVNRYYSESRQKLIDMGMQPCKVCRP